MENDFKIKDISLSELGRKVIELTEPEMPGLMSLRNKYADKKPLLNKSIAVCLSITNSTAVLLETLQELGAEIRCCSSLCSSTQDHIAAALVANGISTYAWKGETYDDYWGCLKKALEFPDGNGPHTMIDDGAEFMGFLTLGLKWEKFYLKTNQIPETPELQFGQDLALFSLVKNIVLQNPGWFTRTTRSIKGVSEETTSGITRLQQLIEADKLFCTAIDVNSSVTKTKFDNIFGCRHSVLDALNRATDILISGKRVLIAGYGDVGKGVAQALKGQNAIIYVAEVDPICALQACLDGHQVKRVSSAVKDCDIFITATGNKMAITVNDMFQMKNNAIVCNVGDGDLEIDKIGLYKNLELKRVEIKPHVHRWIFPDGHGIIVLADGHVANLVCATGHPAFIMSLSFCNQVLAQLELNDPVSADSYLPGEIYTLSKSHDKEVARLHLSSLGVELTTMTLEQTAYMDSRLKGTSKKTK